jgi:peptidoglycan LD-endopeptidase LytH
MGEPDEPQQPAPRQSSSDTSTSDGGQAPTASEGSSDSPDPADATTDQMAPQAYAPFGLFDDFDAPPGPRSTRDILEILHGVGAGEASIARILSPFPVAGAATYSDDWGAPRTTPEPHSHQGCDIFAGRGTPVIAAVQGRITKLSTEGAGGTALRLSASDGTYLYYAHLDRFAPFLFVGTAVAQGEVIGYVGTTGNAEGTAPHLHFEIHLPPGGEAVPPVPYLDRWIAQAMERARAVTGMSTPEPEPAASPLLEEPATENPGIQIVNTAHAAATRAAGAAVRNSVSPFEPVFGLGVIAAVVWLVARRRRAREELHQRLRLSLGANLGVHKENP